MIYAICYATRRNSRADGQGSMPRRWWLQVYALYAPFVEQLYTLLNARQIAVSPCEERGTRFLDPSNTTLALMHTGWLARSGKKERNGRSTPRESRHRQHRRGPHARDAY